MGQGFVHGFSLLASGSIPVLCIMHGRFWAGFLEMELGSGGFIYLPGVDCVVILGAAELSAGGVHLRFRPLD